MDNLNELKAIWQTAGTPNLPGPDEMKRQIKSFQQQRVRKKWMVIVLSSLLAVFISCVTLFSGAKMVTTWLGGMLIALACVLLAVDNWRSMKRFSQLDNCSNREFLAFIERTRQNQLRFYKKTQLLVFSLCITGLVLYLYEPATKRPLYTGILFAATCVYWLLLWFVVRPRVFAKNAAKLNRLKEHAEKLAQQFKEDEK